MGLVFYIFSKFFVLIETNLKNNIESYSLKIILVVIKILLKIIINCYLIVLYRNSVQKTNDFFILNEKSLFIGEIKYIFLKIY